MIEIRSKTKKGFKAIQKNKKDETRLRKVFKRCPERLYSKFFGEETLVYLRDTTSTYTGSSHFIEGKIFTTEEHEIKFKQDLRKEMFKINGSEEHIDYEVLVNGR